MTTEFVGPPIAFPAAASWGPLPVPVNGDPCGCTCCAASSWTVVREGVEWSCAGGCGCSVFVAGAERPGLVMTTSSDWVLKTAIVPEADWDPATVRA